jgi:uncharacterized membrane protein
MSLFYLLLTALIVAGGVLIISFFKLKDHLLTEALIYHLLLRTGAVFLFVLIFGKTIDAIIRWQFKKESEEGQERGVDLTLPPVTPPKE